MILMVMTRNDFNDLVSRLSRQLFGYAYRILRNQEEAEDAVQEVFLKLWNMGGKLEEYSSIKALSVTMTKNYCIDQLRKRRYCDEGSGETQNAFMAPEPSPHEQLETRESSEILKMIIGNLPDIYRDMIQQRDIDGFSYEEIAEKTGQNVNTLRVTLSRARKIIRDEFIKYGYENRRS
jgi:RNA polymerase sigma-70 factor (ECF subfamily)